MHNGYLIFIVGILILGTILAQFLLVLSAKLISSMAKLFKNMNVPLVLYDN